MRFEPAFLDELKSRLSLSEMVGRRVKLVRSGRDWKGCCPFHGEKTPSFYVYADHYHCFGCGAHGDVITFAHQTQGGSFPDTIERLAHEAGLSLPAPDRQAEEKRQVRNGLAEVLEAARLYYREKLESPSGAGARRYLENRGISREIAGEFSFGWAESGGGVISFLKEKGFFLEEMQQSGLVKEAQANHPLRPFFFNRVMIPIFGRKESVLSFGGRVLDDSKPKYLNGPETPLFSKKHLLFHFERARSSFDRETPPVVVEGYMDVVALRQAGIGSAVAPLGTAVTPEQLKLLWRCAPSPVFCFDGDTAGRRAALRVCETAFELLETGRQIRFCFLPQGEDPDSLVRQEGKEKFWKRIGEALSLEESYFGLMAEKISPENPDQRAELRKNLVEASAKIADKVLGSEYRASWMDRFFSAYRFSGSKSRSAAWRKEAPPQRALRHYMAFQPERAPKRGGWELPQGGAGGKIIDLSQARASREDAGKVKAERNRKRYEILFGILLRHPEIFPWIEEAFSRLEFGGEPRFLALKEALFEWYELEAPGSDLQNAGQLAAFLAEKGFEAETAAFSKQAEIETDGVSAAESWWHFYGFLDMAFFEQSVRREIEEALLGQEKPEEGGVFSSALIARIRARDRIRRGEMPELPEEENL